MGRNHKRWRDRRRNKKNQDDRTAANADGGDRRAHGLSKKDQDNYVAQMVKQGNFNMELYYALQGLHNVSFDDSGSLVECKSDEQKMLERAQWRNSMGKILPSSFRFTKHIPENIKQRMHHELQDLIQHTVEKEKEEKEKAEGNNDENNTDNNNDNDDPNNPLLLRRLPFLEYAYQLAYDRTSIRKRVEMERLHDWLKHQTDAGFVSRQETVSMVPPVVLSPAVGDKVLDMCAAPGSKTVQLLEDLEYSKGGCLIAND